MIYSFNFDWCVSRTMPVLTFMCWQWLVWNNDNSKNKAGWRTSSGFHLLMELPALVSWHFWVICFLSCLSRSLGYWCFIAKQEGRQLSDLPMIQPVVIRECSVWTTCSLIFLKHEENIYDYLIKNKFLRDIFYFQIKSLFFKPTARWAKDFLASPCAWCHCVLLLRV